MYAYNICYNLQYNIYDKVCICIYIHMFIFTLSLTVYTSISGIVLALVWCVVLSPVDAGRCSPAVENHLTPRIEKTHYL